MTIQEALKKSNADLRVTCGHRWLVWGEYEKAWVIREAKPYAKQSTILAQTDDESEALDFLTGEL
jgi:hypothetical protein